MEPNMGSKRDEKSPLLSEPSSRSVPALLAIGAKPWHSNGEHTGTTWLSRDKGRLTSRAAFLLF
jgi:hypothetical protein